MPGKRVEFRPTVRVRDDSGVVPGGGACELLVPLTGGASPLNGRSGNDRRHPACALETLPPHRAAPSSCHPEGEHRRLQLLKAATETPQQFRATGNGYHTLPSRLSSRVRRPASVNGHCEASDDLCVAGFSPAPVSIGDFCTRSGRNTPVNPNGDLPDVEWQDWWKNRGHHRACSTTPKCHHHVQHPCSPPHSTETPVCVVSPPLRNAAPFGDSNRQPQQPNGIAARSPSHSATVTRDGRAVLSIQRRQRIIVSTPMRWLCRAQTMALFCSLAALALMLAALGSSHWLTTADGWRQGVLLQCASAHAVRPLPFDVVAPPGGGCLPARNVAYLTAVEALWIGSSLLDGFSIVTIVLALSGRDARQTVLYFRCTYALSSIALLSTTSALILYPVCFSFELEKSNRHVWEFGWAYGVGWGAAIFHLGAVLLLTADCSFFRAKMRQSASAPRTSRPGHVTEITTRSRQHTLIT